MSEELEAHVDRTRMFVWDCLKKLGGVVVHRPRRNGSQGLI